MASTHKHIRSSTANKRPTTAIADGQIALNTNSTSPGLFFKDSTGATIIKVGPVHVGTTAPNVSPAAGGSSGNSTGEIWLDTSLTPNGVKIWNGASWTNATPIGSTTVQGLLELATNAETQTGTDPDRAVTPAGLQSKVSDSTSTTSSTTIASSTAVKAAYDLANAALPASGGTVTGNLEIGTTGSLTFEGSTADGFETALTVVDPTADRTITLPNVTGTVITTGDTGTVTGTMIASGTVTSTNIVDGTIVDADISATAEIAVSKLADGTARQLLQTDAAGTGVEWASNIDVPGTLDVTGAAVFDSSISVTGAAGFSNSVSVTGALTKSGNNVVTVGDTGTVTSAMIADGTIVDADINASAEISVSKLADGTARQLLQTDAAGTGVEWTSNVDIPGTLDVTSAAVFDNTVNIAANLTVDTNTLFVDATNNKVGVGTTSPISPLDVRGIIGAIGAASNNGIIIGDYGSGTAPSTGTFSITAASGKSLVFTDETAAAERARLDSSGRLLVGTSSHTASARASFTGHSGSSTSEGILFLQRGGAASSGNRLGDIRFSDNSDYSFAGIAGEADGTVSGGSKPGRLVFSTTANGASSPTERVRITQNGVLLTYDHSAGLLQGTVGARGFATRTGANGSYGSNVFNFNYTGSVACWIDTTNLGNITLSSDYRIKKNITSQTESAIPRIKQLRPVNFERANYKDLFKEDGIQREGFIAHELAAVIPSAVEGEKDAENQIQSINIDALVSVLTKALQEAIAKIEILEAKVAALESA